MSDTILIYGGSGGIGSAVARAVRAKGLGVHLVGRDAARLEALAGELGGSFTAGDVGEDETFARATQEAASGGALKGLVYAVGTINLKPVARLSEADFLKDFSVNALGAVKAIQAALPHLKQAQGTAGIFATYPAAYLSTFGGLVDQIVGTALLVAAVFALTDERNAPPPAGLTPVLVGLTVMAIGMAFGVNAGYAINPARDFGPRLFT